MRLCERDTVIRIESHGQTLLRLTSWDNEVSMTCRGGCLNDAFLSANMTTGGEHGQGSSGRADQHGLFRGRIFRFEVFSSNRK
jgi:hypothetical protein